MKKILSLVIVLSAIVSFFYLNTHLHVYAAIPTPDPTSAPTPTLTPVPTFDQSSIFIQRFKNTYPEYYNYADNLFGGSSSGSGPTQIGVDHCDPNNLVQYFDGNMNIARQASCICQKESGGVPDETNNTCGKKVPSGNAQEYSVGLFQINQNAHQDYAPECNSYIKTAPTTCTVNDPSGYHTCLTTPHGATGISDLDPSVNAAYAYKLYKASGNSWKAWSTHTACGLN
ncbi:MAG TPA: hypothetical protein VF820_00995 [Patescibacteria group bacterium]